MNSCVKDWRQEGSPSLLASTCACYDSAVMIPGKFYHSTVPFDVIIIETSELLTHHIGLRNGIQSLYVL